MAGKIKMFISYSHKDKEWLDRIRPFLDSLELDYNLKIWKDREIEAGQNWRLEIENAINSSDIALLLISQDFITSKFIQENELPPLLKKASEEKGMIILPLHVRPSDIEYKRNLNQFHPLNPPQNALSGLNEHQMEELLKEIFGNIRQHLDKLLLLDEKEEKPAIPKHTPPLEIIQEQSEHIPLPENLSEKRVLIFDIDGTVLDRDESLSDKGKQRFLELFDFFKDKGFHIVFITGNDFNIQRRRVLEPIIARNLAPAITCFSDGGSRLFQFDNPQDDYAEVKEYSNQNEISENQVKFIEREFKTAFDTFMGDKKHKELNDPDTWEIDRVLYPNGKIKHLDLIIYPLKPSFFEKRFDELAQKIDEIISERNILSVHLIMPRYHMNNAMVLRLRGPSANKDADIIRNSLNALFTNWEDFNRIALPEIEKRGGDFCSQIALKPFKRDELRRDFLDLIIRRLDDPIEGKNVAIILGGKTTIDIQLKGVDKRKAIIQLITGKHKFDPQKMIYFGDEFDPLGNDYVVAKMEDHLRPARIINVGNKDATSGDIANQKCFFVDGNGPLGTLNYLEFLECELSS